MRVSKWGNSLAVRLPSEVVESLRLKVGDEIHIGAVRPDEFLVERTPTREELIARIRTMARPLPAGFRFDRREANGR